MKYRYIFSVIAAFVGFLGIPGFALMQNGLPPKLKLTVSAEKKSYKPGEPVHLIFELKNEGDKSVSFDDVFSTATGFLHVDASITGRDFGHCDAPGWGSVDASGGSPIIIKPNESLQTTVVTLCFGNEQNLPVVRFPDPGSFYIKGSYTFMELKEGNKPASQPYLYLESEPIEIKLEELDGEDLAVWNKIKTNIEITRFILTGYPTISAYKVQEYEKFKPEAEQLVTAYPNSFYGQLLRQTLDKLKVSEERVKAIRGNMKRTN